MAPGRRPPVCVLSRPAVRRREGSILDSCFSLNSIHPQMAGSHICEPLLLARHSHFSRVACTSAVGCFAEIESVTSVWRPERLARGPPAREVRRLEDVSIVPSFRAETQAQKLSLLKMQSVGNPAGYFWRRRKLLFAVRYSPFAFHDSLLGLLILQAVRSQRNFLRL